MGRTDSKEHRADANKKGAMKMLAYCEEILKEKILCLSRKNLVLCCSNLSHRHLFCWTLEMMVKTTSPQFEREGLLIKFLFVFYFVFFVNFHMYKIFFVKIAGLEPPFLNAKISFLLTSSGLKLPVHGGGVVYKPEGRRFDSR